MKKFVTAILFAASIVFVSGCKDEPKGPPTAGQG